MKFYMLKGYRLGIECMNDVVRIVILVLEKKGNVAGREIKLENVLTGFLDGLK